MPDLYAKVLGTDHRRKHHAVTDAQLRHVRTPEAHFSAHAAQGMPLSRGFPLLDTSHPPTTLSLR